MNIINPKLVDQYCELSIRLANDIARLEELKKLIQEVAKEDMTDGPIAVKGILFEVQFSKRATAETFTLPPEEILSEIPGLKQAIKLSVPDCKRLVGEIALKPYLQSIPGNRRQVKVVALAEHLEFVEASPKRLKAVKKVG